MTKQPGDGKVGKIECVVCGEYYWYPHTPHQGSHSIDQPQDYYEYKEFVGKQFGLDEEHELLADDTVINPNKWYDARDDYPQVKIGLKLKH